MTAQTPHRRVLAPRLSTSETFSNVNGGDATSSNPAGTRPAKRRRIACEHCRRSKLRCDGSNGGNRPCQRCQKFSWICTIDTEHRRVSKRSGKLDDPIGPTPSSIQRINQTRSRLSPSSSSRGPEGSTQFILRDSSQQLEGNSERNRDNASEANAAPSETPSDNGLGNQSLEDDARLALNARTGRTIETVTINPERIRHLFDIYFSCYHPLFPVLLPSDSPDAVYETCPLLFWTIIATAARHDSLDFSLLTALLPAVKRLLWCTIPAVPHTLPSLQAMSIFCIWAFPTSSMPFDITFVLAGILKSAAMHAGLHRPDILTHYSRIRYTLGQEELREAVKVWCCIYLAIESVATATGHPPYVPTDRTIEQASGASNPYGLPESLHQALIVQQFCTRVHLAMCDVDRLDGLFSQSTRSSLLKAMEYDLEQLESRLYRQGSDQARTNFLSASFQLQAYWLLNDEETPARREGVLKAFYTATRLIKSVEEDGRREGTTKSSTILTLRVSLTAAILISKVVHSSYRQHVDIQTGKEAVNTVVSIFKSCCVEDNDLSGRTVKILGQLWSIHQHVSEQNPGPPRLALKSRLFFSILHDSLWQ